MDASPTNGRNPAVECLANERMGESHLITTSSFDQHPDVHPLLDEREQEVFVTLRNCHPKIKWHFIPDHCRDGEQSLHLLPEPRQPTIDHMAEERRDADLRQITEHPAITGRTQRSTFLERPQQFTEEERIALRALVEVGK
jgi:hypothetical protein